MFNRSIKANAVFFAVIPSLLTAVIVTFYLMHNMAQERDKLTREQTQNLIEAIAYTSESNLLSENRRNLQSKLREIHSSSSLSIDKITIYDNKGHLFVASNYEEASPVFNPIKLKARTYLIEQKNEKLIASRSIYPFEDNRLDNNVWSKRDVADSFSPPLGYVYLEVDVSRSLYYLYRANFIIFFVILIGTLFTALMMLLLIRRIANPIISIVDTIQDIGSGKLSARVEIPVQYELNDLKIGINMMAAELQENHDKLEAEIVHATQDLQQNLQLVEEKNAELDIARKEAQESNQIKTQFLATMSHEIRTPLTAILGFTKELTKAEVQAPYQDYIETINSSADHLVTIVNDIFDFSKIEAGKMELNSTAYDLNKTMEDIISLMAKDAFIKGLEFNYNACHLPTAVIGDQHRFRQIMSNLLSNAIKFTHKGNIDLSTKLQCEANTQCTLTITVADTGIGINEAKQQKLFSAFNQVETSTSRRYGGTGLGLAITQGLIGQMNGDIDIVSTPGQGSCFIITLPLTIAHKPPLINPLPQLNNVAVLDHQHHNNSLYFNLFEQLGAQVTTFNDIADWEEALRQKQHFDLIVLAADADEEALELLPLQASFAQKLLPAAEITLLLPPHSLIDPEHRENLSQWNKIEKPLSLTKFSQHWLKRTQQNKQTSDQPIVDAINLNIEEKINMLAVDDNEANLKLLATILASDNINLTTTITGQDACQLCLKQKFDLILMDVQMPVMDGVETTKNIRKQGLNTKTPVIAFTAHAFKDERDMLLRQGMDGYLAKPINMNKFDALVKKWVNSEHIAAPATHYSHSSQTEGIDWSLSLQMAGNKYPVAIEMLTMLVDSFVEVRQEIKLARDNRDNEALLSVIHKFHGSTCYTGVTQLKALAFSIESQLKKGVIIDLDDKIAELFNEMIKITQSLEQTNTKKTA